MIVTESTPDPTTLPLYTLINEPNVQGIQISGWTVLSKKGPILNSRELDE